MALGLPQNFCSACQTAFGNMVKLVVSVTPDPCKEIAESQCHRNGATRILQLLAVVPSILKFVDDAHEL